VTGQEAYVVARVLRLARRALVYELGMWRSLLLWVRRRLPAGDAGGQTFGYAQVVTPVIWAFIVVSAIEIPIVHLLVPWPAVRTVLLAAGVYGVLWMIGMLASLKVHPHVVDDVGLRVRNGATVTFAVPWEEIAAVRSRRRSTEGMRSIQVHGEDDGRALSVAVGNQTTVDVVLRRPLPLLAARGDGKPVGAVYLHADDPTALVRRLRAGAPDRLAGEEPQAR
jgi:hypothetical protein